MLGEILLRIALMLFVIAGFLLGCLAASEQISTHSRNSRFWRLWGASVASFVVGLAFMLVIMVRLG